MTVVIDFGGIWGPSWTGFWVYFGGQDGLMLLPKPFQKGTQETSTKDTHPQNSCWIIGGWGEKVSEYQVAMNPK